MKEKMIRLCDYNKEVTEPPRYNKIPSLLKRDVRTGKFTTEFTKDILKELYMKDYPMVVTEKIDGTNVRVYWDGYNFSIWGRKGASEMPEGLLNYLEDKFSNYKMEALFEERFGDKPAVICGEGIGPKITEKYGSGEYGFIGFDIMYNGRYLNYEECDKFFELINITPVPFMGRDTIYNIIELITNLNGTMKSLLNRNIIAEGVVLKPDIELYDNLGNRAILKIKQKDYQLKKQMEE